MSTSITVSGLVAFVGDTFFIISGFGPVHFGDTVCPVTIGQSVTVSLRQWYRKREKGPAITRFYLKDVNHV